jgi:hypothetical protein
MKFSHLEDVNQTYFEHFKDSIKYSFESLKGSLYFFVHAFIPDSYKTNGSEKIKDLHDKIREKYNNMKKTKNNEII